MSENANAPELDVQTLEYVLTRLNETCSIYREQTEMFHNAGCERDAKNAAQRNFAVYSLVCEFSDLLKAQQEVA